MDPETRESLVQGSTNETGGWDLAAFLAAAQERSPRSPLSLFGGTREGGADRAHVTATPKEIRLKNKYFQPLKCLISLFSLFPESRCLYRCQPGTSTQFPSCSCWLRFSTWRLFCIANVQLLSANKVSRIYSQL